jgi:hypothetical protein
MFDAFGNIGIIRAPTPDYEWRSRKPSGFGTIAVWIAATSIGKASGWLRRCLPVLSSCRSRENRRPHHDLRDVRFASAKNFSGVTLTGLR